MSLVVDLIVQRSRDAIGRLSVSRDVIFMLGLLPNIFCDIFQYASRIHSYNTRYATQ